MKGIALLQTQFDRIRRGAFITGAIALVICILAGLRDPTQFFRSYLLAFLFWIGIALGCAAIVMLHHLMGGQWGHVIRRVLESGSGTLPILAALFIPLLIGLPRLYSWAQPSAVAADPALQHKHFYLNPQFFVVRAVIYFAAWSLLAYLLRKWSLEQDRTADPSINRRLEALSGPGLVVYGLTITFAAVDWVMSLEPHWFSTIYGMLFMMVQELAAMAFVIVVVLLLANYEPLSEAVSPDVLNDLGNLLLTFVMLWAYLAFSQFLIIWSGNLQREIPWFAARSRGGWEWLAVALIVLHFAAPFFLLLLRSVKRRGRTLAALAASLLVLTLADLFWLIMPAFGEGGPRLHWTDLLAPVGIGGIWLGVFLSQLKGKPLLPLHDPRFEGVIAHAE